MVSGHNSVKFQNPIPLSFTDRLLLTLVWGLIKHYALYLVSYIYRPFIFCYIKHVSHLWFPLILGTSGLAISSWIAGITEANLPKKKPPKTIYCNLFQIKSFFPCFESRSLKVQHDKQGQLKLTDLICWVFPFLLK